MLLNFQKLGKLFNHFEEIEGEPGEGGGGAHPYWKCSSYCNRTEKFRIQKYIFTAIKGFCSIIKKLITKFLVSDAAVTQHSLLISIIPLFCCDSRETLKVV